MLRSPVTKYPMMILINLLSLHLCILDNFTKDIKIQSVRLLNSLFDSKMLVTFTLNLFIKRNGSLVRNPEVKGFPVLGIKPSIGP